MWQKHFKFFTIFQEYRFMSIRPSETRIERLNAFFIKRPWQWQEKKFTIYHSLYRLDVTPSTYAQISRGHSVSTNSAVNPQSVTLIVLISIDVQTEVLFVTNKCRYTGWKHVENSFFSNLSTLKVRSPYTYIRNLIKHQRIHRIQNAIINHPRCLVYPVVLIFWRIHKTAKRDY